MQVDALDSGVWFANQVSLFGPRRCRRRRRGVGAVSCSLSRHLLASPGVLPVLVLLFRGLALLCRWKTPGRDELRTHETPLASLAARRSPAIADTQVINNSCGTIAALNAVMNVDAPGVEIGSELGNLKEFGAGMGSME